MELECLKRYRRQLILKEVGEEGQNRLKNSKILIVGIGGLGSPTALYLTAAGVGHIGIADFDCVDLSNLQRQILHSTLDIGKNKVVSAKNKLNALNPGVDVSTYAEKLNAINIKKIMQNYTRYYWKLTSDGGIKIYIKNW